MPGPAPQDSTLRRGDDHWVGAFRAMASPCELLVDSDDRELAARLLAIVAGEAARVETKFSRYRDDGIVHAINSGAGPVEVDDETAKLIDFADRLHRISDGSFDITSGVLRRAWRFDGGDRIPAAADVGAVLELIGWERVEWDGTRIRLEPGMEIDLGGIGKEYAVDQAAGLVARLADAPSCLVNFGGDLRVTRPRDAGGQWRVGIDDPRRPGAVRTIRLARGALATSGDAQRFLLRDGVRYGHILDPRSGWPVAGAPRSVTVAAGTCTEAGVSATLAMLRGAGAEAMLEAEGISHWVVR